MRSPPLVRFGRFNLLVEVSVLALTSGILFLAIGFTLHEINRRYLELRLTDAAKVNLFLESQLQEARRSLTTFADLPEAERSPAILTLFAAFADLYRLDPQLRVARVYKATPDSKVFTGFSFAGGKLGTYLQSDLEGSDSSEIMRGHEDEAPSVYYVVQRGGQRYLGRLNLDYVRALLAQFSHFSGTPVLLVARDGFVMLASDPELRIPAVDLRKWEGEPSPDRTLITNEQAWIPVISGTSTIGAHIVALIPTELLTSQRRALLAFASLFTGVLVLLVFLKNRRLDRLVVQPLAAFTRKMGDLAAGRLPTPDEGRNHRFVELAEIHAGFRDMATAIRDREASLRASEHRAEAANRAKSVFLANMSHEIRTPLNAILGYAQVLVRDANLTDEQRRNLTTIRRSGEHLLTLINDILDLAKIEAGRLTCQVTPFDLARLLNEVTALFAQQARDRGLDLRLEMGPLPGLVAGDERKLRQVLINLLGNALKFTAAGEVALRVEASPSEGLRFSVSDTGPGIPLKDQTRIFQPFAQAEAGRKTQGGTGLGLALSSQFVRLMGGDLRVDSTPGQGSCFSFTLPLPAVDTPLPAGLPAPARPQATPPAPALEPPLEMPLPLAHLSPSRVLTRLAALPPGWRAELEQAVDMGDFDRITRLVDQAREQNPVLAAALGTWAYDYNLEAFAQALAALGEGTRPDEDRP